MSSRSSSSHIRRRRKERSFGASSRYKATNWRSSYMAAEGAHAPSLCCAPYMNSGAPDKIERCRRAAAYLNGRQHHRDRKSVMTGTMAVSVELGGRSVMKKKNDNN